MRTPFLQNGVEASTWIQEPCELGMETEKGAAMESSWGL
jgi:hypothetical protein